MHGILEKSIIATVYFIASTATFNLNKHILVNLGFKMQYMLIMAQSTIIIIMVGIQAFA